MATGFTDLPAGTARTCLERSLRSGITPDNLSDLDPGAYRGTPLEKRLLEAWYIGLFKLDGSSEIRSYDTTLMWRAAGIDPPPTTCNGGPARWASAPSNI
jgi:Membrane bound FAD containing D-sorbitol dehydrogenase